MVQRHKRFIKCLKSTGVTVELSRFKEKDVRFRTSNDSGDLVEGVLKRNEEKETDVAIAAKLFELPSLPLGDTPPFAEVVGDSNARFRRV